MAVGPIFVHDDRTTLCHLNTMFIPNTLNAHKAADGNYLQLTSAEEC